MLAVRPTTTTETEVTTMQTTTDFHRLLNAFETHQRLRRSGAPIATLSESRARLDELRLAVRRSTLR